MRAVEDVVVDIWAAQDTWVEDGGAPGKARLQRTKEGAGLDKHDRRVLGHLEQLGTQGVGGSGGAATPVSLALLDLAADLDKMEAEYDVVVGDWNVRHPKGEPGENAAGRGDTIVVRRFAQSRGLVEPLKKRLDWGEVEPRTYNTGGKESWIDYYLVGKSLVDRGPLRIRPQEHL